MSEYTPTTDQVRSGFAAVARALGDGDVEQEFDRWLAGEIEAAVQQGYKEALRNAAEQCANYSGHPYNAAATLSLGFSMAVGIMEKEDA